MIFSAFIFGYGYFCVFFFDKVECGSKVEELLVMNRIEKKDILLIERELCNYG